MSHNCDLFVTLLDQQLTFIVSPWVLYSCHDFNAHLVFLVDGKHIHMLTFQTWEMSLWPILWTMKMKQPRNLGYCLLEFMTVSGHIQQLEHSQWFCRISMTTLHDAHRTFTCKSCRWLLGLRVFVERRHSTNEWGASVILEERQKPLILFSLPPLIRHSVCF